MPAVFQLVLDTTAPVVDWGAVGGASAGELLQVAYVSNEPLDTARLQLADGRWLEMTIAADHLSVLLPADAPQGWATIEVADDVGNTTTTMVLLAGVALPDVTTPPSGPPTRRPTRRRTFTRRVAIDVRSTSLTRVSVVRVATIVTTSRSSATIAQGAHRRTVTFTLTSAHSAAATRVLSSPIAVNVTSTVGRADGEEITALIALGVL